MKKIICCICGKKYSSYGNNAQPIKSGRCCDTCNIELVIPKRMKILEKYNENTY